MTHACQRHHLRSKSIHFSYEGTHWKTQEMLGHSRLCQMP